MKPTRLSAHQQRITAYLGKLHIDIDDIRGYQLLHKGFSGALVYRLSLIQSDAVLKITQTRSGRVAMERAQRELAFYRDLADAIPLRTPEVMSIYNDQEGFAILLTAYQPPVPPVQWQESDFMEAIRQLAQFHTMFWDKREQLSSFPWIRERGQAESAADIQNAYGYWQALGEQSRFAGVLSAPEMKWIHRLISRMETVNEVIRSWPPTLCHGDCNTTNVLRDSMGQMIWADWQEVRIARGLEDVAFFLERASIAGAHIPYDTVLAAYRERLEIETSQSLSLDSMHRAVRAAELRSRTLHWPAYLAQASEQELVNMVQQLHVLAGQLGY